MFRNSRNVLLLIIFVGAVIAAAMLMNISKLGAGGGSGSVSKQTFLATLKKFVEQYGPTELRMIVTRETESRYQWLAELKSRLGSGTCSVVYAYSINGKQFLIGTDESHERVLAVRLQPGGDVAEENMRAWLNREFRALSSGLSVKVQMIEEEELTEDE